MAWPTTWASLCAYRYRAPCGCRYAISAGAIAVSPNRMQRCFRHMRAGAVGDDEVVESLVGRARP